MKCVHAMDIMAANRCPVDRQSIQAQMKHSGLYRFINHAAAGPVS
jgi:hypothetical protein